MSPLKVIKVDPINPKEEQIKEAVQVLESGKLIIIPTDTVYGIAADAANPEAVKKLCAAKKRPKDKPFVLLVAEKNKAEEFAAEIPIAAYKLMYKFWPGALTLVFKSKSGGTIGLRMPDNQIALKIISEAHTAIACPSANISGRLAPSEFQEALNSLGPFAELAIDAGPTGLKKESSVVDLTVAPLKILREGAVKKKEIEAVALKESVLFVCTGNSCRSVIAKALLEKKLKEKKKDNIEVLSAGIMMLGGLGASEGAKEVLAKEGIDVSAHRSQRVTPEMIKKCDIILVMEKLQEQRILELVPNVKNRLFLLKEFAKIEDSNLDIGDPIGRDRNFYEDTYYVIMEAVERISAVI